MMVDAGSKGVNAAGLSQRMCRGGGFTLIEVMTALAILALICSSVWVVIDRCTASAADSALQMAAFDVARENMEKILSSSSVKETVEYGTCEKYPDIAWQTVVETFSEPVTGKMWVRAVCSAEYTDTAGQTQTVELTHWLTKLTEQQLAEVMKQKELTEAEMADQIIDTVEQAAEYAGVDVETIEQWAKNGLVKAEDGSFIKRNLDLFVQSKGNPSAEDKGRQVKSVAELLEQAKQQARLAEQGPPKLSQPSDEIDQATGLKYEELEKMSVQQVMELLKQRRQKQP